MTVNELLAKGVAMLKAVSIDDAQFDARCMLEDALKIDTTHLMLMKRETVESSAAEKFNAMLKRRIDGEPLQYILGQWEFCSLPFLVGEGVLIPRPETEMLVDFAVDFLKEKNNPVVFDLCSGSGCIAISVAKKCKNARVYAVEKSSKAFEFLEKNIELNKVENVTAVLGDIFDKTLLSEIEPDLILSNPPYIRSADIEPLQREVKREPRMALDGGEDGFDFYRAICSEWFKRLQKGGALALECAEDQTEDITQMLSHKVCEVQTKLDFSGLPRVVIAEK